MASDKELQLHIKGMHCSGCANTIERKLQSIGFQESSVQFASSRATIPATNKSDETTIINQIKQLGYTVHKITKDSPIEADRPDSVSLKLVISIVFTIPLLLHMFVSTPLIHSPIFQLLCSTPVFLIGLSHFGVSAWRALRAGTTNMDVLIIIGIAASYFYSLYGTILGLGADYQFYEAAASIVCFVLIGNALEKRAVQKTSSALFDLISLQPKKVKRLTKESDQIEDISIDEVTIQDILVAGSGDQIGADGIIVHGSAAIDESLLTGESKPVSKQIGDMVIAGTYILSGSIQSEVSTLKNDSILSQMIDLVRDAEKNKPDIQRLGDLVSNYFVPLVLIISLLTFALSFFMFNIPSGEALIRAVAVLVISCPCAMGLATPTAVMVGVGKAAKKGIVIKGGDTLERLTNVKEIIFDKTGTLTNVGNVEIILSSQKHSQEDVENILYSIEKHSSHPLAKAITRKLKNSKLIPLIKVQEKKGIGIFAESDSNHYSITSALQEDDEADLFLKENDNVIAKLRMIEELKDNTKELIEKISDYGITVSIVSGDKKERVKSIAEELAIDEYYSEKLPDEKLRILSDKQKNGAVAFVGDGINDAASLAKADIGISLSSATDIAAQSADLILLGDNISQLYDAITISQLTLRTIKQNLFWAFCYNIVAIPIAALGYLNPMLAAIAMAFSDVVVIGNSLRIHLKK